MRIFIVFGSLEIFSKSAISKLNSKMFTHEPSRTLYKGSKSNAYVRQNWYIFWNEFLIIYHDSMYNIYIDNKLKWLIMPILNSATFWPAGFYSFAYETDQSPGESNHNNCFSHNSVDLNDQNWKNEYYFQLLMTLPWSYLISTKSIFIVSQRKK